MIVPAPAGLGPGEPLGPEGYRLDGARRRGDDRGGGRRRPLLRRADAARALRGRAAAPTSTIADRPRFAWRGAMLDVARHFFGVADVCRLIDHLAAYKLNVLHLHLSDDQGWRLAIDALAAAGRGRRPRRGGRRPRRLLHAGRLPRDRRLRGRAASSPSCRRSTRPATSRPRSRPTPSWRATAAATPTPAPRSASPRSTPTTSAPTASSTTCSASSPRSRRAPTCTSAATRRTARRARTTARSWRACSRSWRRHGKRVAGWEEIASVPLAAGAVVQYWNTMGDARAATSPAPPSRRARGSSCRRATASTWT